jgi:hypothetical protein
MVLGTVCVSRCRAPAVGAGGLDTIKSMAAELVERIELREGGF